MQQWTTLVKMNFSIDNLNIDVFNLLKKSLKPEYRMSILFFKISTIPGYFILGFFKTQDKWWNIHPCSSWLGTIILYHWLFDASAADNFWNLCHTMSNCFLCHIVFNYIRYVNFNTQICSTFFTYSFPKSSAAECSMWERVYQYQTCPQ